MREIIEVKRGDGTFSHIVVGDVIKELRSYLPQKRVIVITDSNVHRRYYKIIDEFEHIIIGIGETHKTLITVEKIYNELIAMNIDRECFILGIGGGIVTDIAGFVASTYMRGLSFGFVSTTLLGQVDASVGGKNGVNIDSYKNMAGTFNQPDFVLCDTSLLKTLPDREFRAGIAEVIKSGIIGDLSLFEVFENHTIDEIKSDKKLLMQIIASSIRVKARIVETDEHEVGERKLLNLGHTFAHAIEKCSNEYVHGEAVAIGIAMITDLSVHLGILDFTVAGRINRVIENAGFPLTSKVDIKRQMQALKHDKKRDDTSINMILIKNIGKCVIHKMPISELEGNY